MTQAGSRFDLTGKTALVTGAAQGIGRAIALALAEHGADVILLDVADVGRTQAVADSITAMGRRAWARQHDLSQTDTLGDVADELWTLAGRIDILVNNAAIAFLEHFNEITPQRWRTLMAVNVDAVFFLTQRVAQRMIEHRIAGRVINLSSKNGQVAEPGLAHYNTSKGAVELLTQSLACELGPHGITVNALTPGVVITDIGRDFKVDQAFTDHIKAHVPLEGRYAHVDEIAAGAVFLASQGASYVNGHSLVIDGGVLAQQMPRLGFMSPFKLRLPD